MSSRLAAVSLLLLAVPAFAQPAASTTPAAATAADDSAAIAPSALKLDVNMRAWYVAPSGDLQFPGAGRDELTLESLNADSPRLAPYGQAVLTSDPWMVSLSGFGFSSERSATSTFTASVGPLAIAPGDRLTTSLEFQSAQALLGYRLFAQSAPDWLRLRALAGLTVHSIDASIASGAVTVQADQLALEVTGGAMVSVNFIPELDADLWLTAGGGADSLSFDLATAFTYRPLPWLNIHAGYRFMAVNIEDGSGTQRFRWDGSLAGLFFGLGVRF
ncbi:MAG: hypothetical protein ACK51N_06210 [bacterium]|jgi:hypothetical protein|nr:hypothetical protein [Phycisphaerales bacterium]MCE2652774.1 hypothetical protein [Planctomycetaceae bacterium]